MFFILFYVFPPIFLLGNLLVCETLTPGEQSVKRKKTSYFSLTVLFPILFFVAAAVVGGMEKCGKSNNNEHFQWKCVSVVT